MRDQQFNDYLVVFIEKNVVDCIDDETIIQQSKNIKTRRIKFQNFMYLRMIFSLCNVNIFKFYIFIKIGLI